MEFSSEQYEDAENNWDFFVVAFMINLMFIILFEKNIKKKIFF